MYTPASRAASCKYVTLTVGMKDELINWSIHHAHAEQTYTFNNCAFGDAKLIGNHPVLSTAPQSVQNNCYPHAGL